jgi:uncharacterized membrane protein
MRLFGHPVHPMLVALPLGQLTLSPLWDALSWLDELPEAAHVAYWTQLVGLVGGALAAVTGVADLILHADQPQVLTTGLRHALLAGTALSLFLVAFAIRSSAPPSLTVCVLDVLGAGCLAVAGWLGGHLVFHHQAGVDARPEHDAVAKAPSE